MMTEWNNLPETLQLHLAASALRQAREKLAIFAETLADTVDGDLSGPEILRFFAAMVRAAAGQHAAAAVGHA